MDEVPSTVDPTTDGKGSTPWTNLASKEIPRAKSATYYLVVPYMDYQSQAVGAGFCGEAQCTVIAADCASWDCRAKGQPTVFQGQCAMCRRTVATAA